METIYYLFTEFDGPYGRSRASFGFYTPEARAAYLARTSPAPGDEWSDMEEWEAPRSEWPHIKILGSVYG